MREGGDEGTPIVVSDPNSLAAKALTFVAEQLIAALPAPVRA